MPITYPGAKWTPLAGNQTQPRMTSHDIVCLHTMVGYLTSTDGYFRVSNGRGFDGTESHFGIGGPWGPDLGGGLDGMVYQWQDLAYTADANYLGNSRVISIETADNAVRPIAAWSSAQLGAIIDLVRWLCSVEAHAKCPPSWQCNQAGIPCRPVPDSRIGHRGVAWHSQGCEGSAYWRGGQLWSTSYGKDCPTEVRISQLLTTVIPHAARGGVLAPEDDMTPDEHQKLYEAHANAAAARGAAEKAYNAANRSASGVAQVIPAVAKLAADQAADAALTRQILDRLAQTTPGGGAAIPVDYGQVQAASERAVRAVLGDLDQTPGGTP